MAKKYKKEVNEFMTGVRSFLNAKYGNIDPSWECGLYMMADNYQTFLICQDDIAENGMFLTNRFGDRVKNDSIKIKNDAQIQLVKLLNEYGLTAHSLGKLKENSDTDTAEILEKLMN